MPGNDEAPHRACRLTAKIEADTPHELACYLMHMAQQIERGQLSNGVSGGPSSGAIYELTVADRPTHDEYFEEVRRYLAAKDAEKAALATPPAGA